MSNRKRNSRAITKKRPSPTAFTAEPPPAEPLLASMAGPGDPALAWRWAIFAVVALGIAFGWGWYAVSEAGVWPSWLAGEGRLLGGDPWKPPEWAPANAEDRLIDRFAALQRLRDPSAFTLLTPLPSADDVLSEEEFERAAANHFLRDGEVKVVDVWKGEPGKDGKPAPAAGRYMLITRGNASTPVMKERDAAGKVSPSSYGLHDPVIVVEVAGGKVRPLRAEINQAP